MKKHQINFQLNFNNRAIYTLITFAVFLVIGVTVFAFGTSNPSTFGHSAGELDLSTGVDGDVVFNGNLDVGGNIDVTGDMKTSGNLNVAKAIKIGTSATCNSNTEGSLRYNSVNKKMEFCNSSSWAAFGVGEVNELVSGISVGSATIGWSYNPTIDTRCSTCSNPVGQAECISYNVRPGCPANTFISCPEGSKAVEITNTLYFCIWQ